MAGGWGNSFWQNHWKFRFVTLYTPRNSRQNGASPLEFPKLVSHPLDIPMPISKTCGNSEWFFLDHPCKFIFLAAPGISAFCLEIPCPFFSEITYSHSYTDWLIFCCRNFILCQKKKHWCRKQHSCLYCELAPLTMLETLEIQRKYRW